MEFDSLSQCKIFNYHLRHAGGPLATGISNCLTYYINDNAIYDSVFSDYSYSHRYNMREVKGCYYPDYREDKRINSVTSFMVSKSWSFIDTNGNPIDPYYSYLTEKIAYSYANNNISQIEYELVDTVTKNVLERRIGKYWYSNNNKLAKEELEIFGDQNSLITAYHFYDDMQRISECMYITSLNDTIIHDYAYQESSGELISEHSIKSSTQTEVQFWYYDNTKAINSDFRKSSNSLFSCKKTPGNSLSITFTVANQIPVSLSLFNIQGRFLHLFSNKVFKKGVYTITEDLNDLNKLASGVFFIR